MSHILYLPLFLYLLDNPCPGTVMFKPQKPVRQGRHAQETEPERVYRLKECCDLLLAGGYFRARMPTLSPFDKVVGGMVWCITASNVDVDVDLLYEENSSIGERIGVSENIVRSLSLMKCPFALQSFQIQGLDYNSILPVLKWLIRQVIETRALTGDENRKLSVQNFSNIEDQLISYHQQQQQQQKQQHNLSLPLTKYDSERDATLENAHHKLFPNDNFIMNSIFSASKYANTYHTTRKYKKRRNTVYQSDIERVESTLLEYDDRHLRLAVDLEQHDMELSKKQNTQQSTTQGMKRNIDSVSDIALLQQQLGDGSSHLSALAQESADVQRLQEESRLKDAQDRLDRIEDAGNVHKIHASLVGDIVSLQSEEIQRARDMYQKETGDGSATGVNPQKQKEIEEQRHQRQCENLQRKIKELQDSISTKQQEYEHIKQSHQEATQKASTAQSTIDTIHASMKELDEIEQKSENRELLEDLKQLVVLNEQLKRQESTFKQSCKEQFAIYQEQLQHILSLSSDDSDQASKIQQIQSLLEREQLRYNKIKNLVYERHLDLLTVYHKIDEIPTRAELLQFEKRFVELYEITSRKLIETRGYFSWYNTLSVTYNFLQQELTLLESILSNFTIGMKTKASQEAMKNQMAAIITTVEENIQSTQAELEDVIAEETLINAEYTKLLTRERNYFKLVKQFQLECDLNEQLLQVISEYE